MTSKVEKDRAKLVQEKCQELLTDLLRDDDNKYCVDCDAKGPRWASWNLGIFLCIRCAGIHRNLGVHISKVKSINLDSWTPEQVGSIQQMGNSKARAVYEANLPDGHRRPQTDSALEAFIRSKYEQRKYIAREWVQPSVTPAFDIEEEVKKDKEKKRQTNKPTATGIRGPSITSSLTSDQNNSVPRPVSTHPASTTIFADKVPKDSPFSLSGSKSNNDLLGINFADSGLVDVGTNIQSLKGNTGSASDGDLFAAFDGKSGQVKSAKDEEADFFNQKAPDMSKKLDTNSILKLYDSNSTGSSALFNPIPAMTTQQQPQLPYGLQTLQTNPVPTSFQQQPFGAFPQVTNLMQQPMVPGGLVPAVNSLSQSLLPPSQTQSFGVPVAPVPTNPFLSTTGPTPVSSMSGLSITQPTTNVHQMNQLGSLQLNSNLINNWLGTSLPSAAPTTTTSVSSASSSILSADLFSGLNGSFNKTSSHVPEPVVPVTSVNPFITSAPPTIATNGLFNDSTFASFPTSFPDAVANSSLPAAATSLSSQVQSDFGNLNWANFNQAPIPSGGPSVAPSSVLPSSSDLWQ